MSDGKSRIEVVLMPLVIAVVGAVGTYLVTAQQQRSAEMRSEQQQRSAEIMSRTQMETTKELARADQQLKVLELFAEKITSTNSSERILALSILEAVDPQLASTLARSIAESESEESPVKLAAQNVARKAIQEALSGTYFMDSGRDRIIVVTHLEGDEYRIEEQSGPSPWSGTARLDGNRLRGRATFRKTKAEMNVDAQLRVDGSVFVSYEIVTTGTGEAAEDVVHHQVWYPSAPGSLLQTGESLSRLQ